MHFFIDKKWKNLFQVVFVFIQYEIQFLIQSLKREFQ